MSADHRFSLPDQDSGLGRPSATGGFDRAVRAPAAIPPTSLRRGTPSHVLYRVAYLPRDEHAQSLELGLLDATVHRQHVDYRRELQETMEHLIAGSGHAVAIVPLDVAGLVAFARDEGRDPGSRTTRLAYSDSLADDGRDVPWPPERNGACWCGSGRKYKKCCGTPGFCADIPDPASLVLRIELDGAEPPVWRRIAVPSNTLLDEVHMLIQRAMGWQDDHLYAFETTDVRVLGPQSWDREYSAEDERLVSIATEVGDSFTYVYDFGDDWTHTVTVEEINEAGELNQPRIRDGAGARPPEDSGGIGRYRYLLDALAKPSHPDHGEAVEWFGEGFDPTRYALPVAH